MDEENKQNGAVADVRQLHNTPVMFEGVVGWATWDEGTEQLCFVPDVQSPGYRDAAAKDGADWNQWVIEYPVRVAGQLLVLETVE